MHRKDQFRLQPEFTGHCSLKIFDDPFAGRCGVHVVGDVIGYMLVVNFYSVCDLSFQVAYFPAPFRGL